MSEMTDSTSTETTAPADPANTQEPGGKRKTKVQVLGFKLGQREFGLDVDNVIEIIQQVEVTDIPEAPEYVEGMLNIRETVIPLINTHKMLGLGDKSYDINTQIIIVYGKSGIVGLLVDNVTDILSVPRRLVMRPSRSSTQLSEFVSGYIDRKGSLTLLLDVKKLVEQERWGDATTRSPAMVTGDPGVESGLDRTRTILRQRALELGKKHTEERTTKLRLITFSQGEEWYGIDVVKVKEVSNAVDMYFIPSAPDYVSGVINLRGAVVPVVDLSAVLGLSNSPDPATASIIVVEQNKVSMGLLTNQIGDIVNVPASSVEKPLATIENDRAACIEGLVEWNGKLLGILRLQNIVRLTVRGKK